MSKTSGVSKKCSKSNVVKIQTNLTKILLSFNPQKWSLEGFSADFSAFYERTLKLTAVFQGCWNICGHGDLSTPYFGRKP